MKTKSNRILLTIPREVYNYFLELSKKDIDNQLVVKQVRALCIKEYKKNTEIGEIENGN